MEQPVNQEGQQSLEFWKAVFKEDRQIKAEVFNDDKGRASLVVQTIKNLSAMQETWVDPWVGKIPWRREQLQLLTKFIFIFSLSAFYAKTTP